MKKVVLLLSTIFMANVSFAQFDGAVGTVGCQAISISNPNVNSWAKGVQVKRGTISNSSTVYASFGKPYMAQGRPDSTTTSAISLGNRGEAIVTFDRPIINGNGYDFAVYENSFSPTYLELAFVEVSSDGINYFRFPAISNASSEQNINPTLINNLAGKYQVGYGTPFDLSTIPNNILLDKSNVRFVKLIDVIGGQDTDINGNIIYDASSGGYSTGFDFTGICIINGGNPYLIADLEGILASSNSCINTNSTNGIDDGTGTYRHNFNSNNIIFEGVAQYGGSFSFGFFLSNRSTMGGANQCASTPGMGIEGIGSSYAPAYYSDYAGSIEHNVVRMIDSSAFRPKGVYVTNDSSTYKYMRTNFTNNDWLLLVAYGYDVNGSIKDSVSIYLSDLRVNNNFELDALNEWKWLDLSSLDTCSKVIFKLKSSDMSAYGMNVPSYFALDNFVIDTTTVNSNIPIILNTLAATDIQTNSATLNGYIDAGSQIIDEKGFQWKLNSDNNWSNVSISTDSLSYLLNNLIEDTTYIYRIYAISDNDTIYGNEISFKTLRNSSFESIENNISFSIYPNPSNGIVNINIEGVYTDAKIIIYDLNARVVMSQNIISNPKSINLDLNNINKGVYSIRIITPNFISTKKLILQ
ncbi:MAG: aggregation factor core protein MAFp3, isoform [Bacteroidetes bacterium]|nr:aggregation factor core protein MAFp3, isoform [Bacteroidota bacterium]